jgi:hypothetical protein
MGCTLKEIVGLFPAKKGGTARNINLAPLLGEVFLFVWISLHPDPLPHGERE